MRTSAAAKPICSRCRAHDSGPLLHRRRAETSFRSVHEEGRPKRKAFVGWHDREKDLWRETTMTFASCRQLLYTKPGTTVVDPLRVASHRLLLLPVDNNPGPPERCSRPASARGGSRCLCLCHVQHPRMYSEHQFVSRYIHKIAFATDEARGNNQVSWNKKTS